MASPRILGRGLKQLAESRPQNLLRTRNRLRTAYPCATIVGRFSTLPGASQSRTAHTAATPHSIESDTIGPTPSEQISPENTYDIVIIGAGNAGLALACSLLAKPSLSSNSRVLLVEGGTLDRVRSWDDQGPWENRVSSLTAENVVFLKSIGAWDHIAAHRSCAVQEMIVWTAITPSKTSGIEFPELQVPMAQMTENTNLQRALLRRIEEVGNGRVDIREGGRVEEMVMSEGGRSVRIKLGGSEAWVRGSVVVGADGPNSPVRAFSKISSFGHAYNTHAVVATLQHAPTSNHTAFQRFLPTGPIAFLPLDSTSTTLVWSTSPEHAAAYKTVGHEVFRYLVDCGFHMEESALKELNEMVLAAVGMKETINLDYLKNIVDDLKKRMSIGDANSLPPFITSVDPRSIAGFPLKLTHAESYVGDRTVLVGDAAHTIHPLAGQGLNMGLADVKELGDVWEMVSKTGGDLGAYTSLLPYAQVRYPANHLLLSTTDKLHHIFRNRLPLVNWARSVGMDVINELGPVKKALMERAGARPVTDQKQSVYGTAANGLEGWQTVKTFGSLAVNVGGEAVKNGARRLLERIAK